MQLDIFTLFYTHGKKIKGKKGIENIFPTNAAAMHGFSTEKKHFLFMQFHDTRAAVSSTIFFATEVDSLPLVYTANLFFSLDLLLLAEYLFSAASRNSKEAVSLNNTAHLVHRLNK